MKKEWLFLPFVCFVSACSSSSHPIQFEIIAEKAEMKVGETQTLRLSSAYENIRWTSSNNFVARVTDGLVTAYNIGECLIYAQVKDVQKEFSLHVIEKDLEIHSFAELSKILSNNLEYEYEAQEIHYTETNSASQRTNQETLYRYGNGRYSVQEESYIRAGSEMKENVTLYQGTQDNFFYNLYISASSYVQKYEIVEASPTTDQILKSDVEEYLQAPTYLKKFFNSFQDAYSGYVNQEDIVVQQENQKDHILVNFSSFSKKVWSNGVNCDYKTYEAQFTFSFEGKLRALTYEMNNYGDEQFDVSKDRLKEDAKAIDTYSSTLTYFLNNSLLECPIDVHYYFVSEIKEASYSKEIRVNDIVLSSQIHLDQYSPMTSYDMNDIVILEVMNPKDQVVLYSDGESITAVSKGDAALLIAMRYSRNVTYELKVKVI